MNSRGIRTQIQSMDNCFHNWLYHLYLHTLFASLNSATDTKKQQNEIHTPPADITQHGHTQNQQSHTHPLLHSPFRIRPLSPPPSINYYSSLDFLSLNKCFIHASTYLSTCPCPCLLLYSGAHRAQDATSASRANRWHSSPSPSPCFPFISWGASSLAPCHPASLPASQVIIMFNSGDSSHHSRTTGASDGNFSQWSTMHNAQWSLQVFARNLFKPWDPRSK